MVRALDEKLQDLQRDANHGRIAGVQRRLDRDDQLRNHVEDAGATVLQQVLDSLHGEETVRLLLLSDSVKEDGEVVVVVQRLDVGLPDDDVLHAFMLHRDGQVTALVEFAEPRVGRVISFVECVAGGRLALSHRLLLGTNLNQVAIALPEVLARVGLGGRPKVLELRAHELRHLDVNVAHVPTGPAMARDRMRLVEALQKRRRSATTTTRAGSDDAMETSAGGTE